MREQDIYDFHILIISFTIRQEQVKWGGGRVVKTPALGRFDSSSNPGTTMIFFVKVLVEYKIKPCAT